MLLVALPTVSYELIHHRNATQLLLSKLNCFLRLPSFFFVSFFSSYSFFIVDQAPFEDLPRSTDHIWNYRRMKEVLLTGSLGFLLITFGLLAAPGGKVLQLLLASQADHSTLIKTLDLPPLFLPLNITVAFFHDIFSALVGQGVSIQFQMSSNLYGQFSLTKSFSSVFMIPISYQLGVLFLSIQLPLLTFVLLFAARPREPLKAR